jgi:RNAse (barnase) inhibitor barstar
MDALWDLLHCRYDFSTTIVLKNLPAMPRELREEAADMLQLFHDLEKKDNVNILIDNTDDHNISDYLI